VRELLAPAHVAFGDIYFHSVIGWPNPHRAVQVMAASRHATAVIFYGSLNLSYLTISAQPSLLQV
jgi:hypothetical protein